MKVIPAKLATVTQRVKGKEITVHIHELSDPVSIPAKEGGHYISRFCDFKIENGPFENMAVGVDHFSSGQQSKQHQQEFQLWMPRRAHWILTKILCGRAQRPKDIPVFAKVKLDEPPYGPDVRKFRKRCRYDVLRVIDDYLNMYKRPDSLTLTFVQNSHKLSRLYSPEQLSSALAYWQREADLFNTRHRDNEYVVDDGMDDEIAELIEQYDWEECEYVTGPEDDRLVVGEKTHDVFICHASEDKDSFVRPLAEALRDAGIKVWYDEFSLKWGDKLRAKIDEGLSNSRYGIVVLSKHFFKKEWPQAELEGLLALESGGKDGGKKVILPIWHELNSHEVKEYSPLLAGRLAINSDLGIESVVEQVREIISS